MKKHEELKLDLVNGKNKDIYICHISDECHIILNCRKQEWKDYLFFEYRWFKQMYLTGALHSSLKNKVVIDEFMKAFIKLYGEDYRIYPKYSEYAIAFNFPIRCKANLVEGLRMISKMTSLFDYVEKLVQDGKNIKYEITDMGICYGLYIPVIQDQLLDEFNNHFDFAVTYNKGNSLLYIHKFMVQNEMENYYRGSAKESFREKAFMHKESLYLQLLEKYRKKREREFNGIDIDIASYKQKDIIFEYYKRTDNVKKGMCIVINAEKDLLYVYISNLSASIQQIVKLSQEGIISLDIVSHISNGKINEYVRERNKLALRTDINQKGLNDLWIIFDVVSQYK